MLTMLNRPASLCDGFSRQEAMRIGGLSAMGLSLPQLLQRPVVAGRQAEATPGFGREKSVNSLWLPGGPPQHETWDPCDQTGWPFPLSRGQVIREIVG